MRKILLGHHVPFWAQFAPLFKLIYLEALIALEAVLDTLPAAHLVSSDSSGIERHNLLFDLVLIHRGNLGTGERGNVIYQDYNLAF